MSVSELVCVGVEQPSSHERGGWGGGLRGAAALWLRTSRGSCAAKHDTSLETFREGACYFNILFCA